MLLIVLITPLIAALAVPPCLIATIKVFSKFGALKERSYHEIIWLQILKTPREGKNAVRELRRCDERVRMFQCLVMYISLNEIYYIHTRARYILAISGLATCVAYTGHACGVRANFSNILSAGGSTGEASREERAAQKSLSERSHKWRSI
jgi:hypothetical protein